MAFGYTPRQIDQLSLWEITACMDGWRMMNGIKDSDGEDWTEQELRELGIVGF